MRNKGSTERAQTVSDMVEQMFPNVSTAQKENIAQVMYTQLSDGVIKEVADKLAEE